MAENSNDLFGSISISGNKKPAKPSEKKSVSPPKQQKPPRQKPRQSSKGMSGTVKFLFIGLVGVALYAGLGYFLVPHLVNDSLPKYLEEKIAVKFSVDEAQFNPFNFKLSLSGISVETDEDGEPQRRFLSISNAIIDLDLLSLLRGDLVCSTMDINRLQVQLSRDKNKRYNISYLLRNRSKRNESGIIDFAELPFLFSLNNIKIGDSQIIFDDQSTGKTHHLEEIELALPAISNFPYHSDSYIHPRFSAVINGSPIRLTGEAAFGTSSQDGRQTLLSCDLNDIDIPLYFDYLPVSLPVDVNQGKANGKLQISFSPDQDKGSQLKIQFSFSATELSLESRNSKLSIKVPTAKFEGIVEPFNQTLAIQNILLREPTVISDGIITRDTLSNLVPLTMRPGPADPLHQVIPAISVKLLIADGGSVIIKKTNEKKPIRIWHSLQLSIKNFSNSLLVPSEEENSFRLSGEHLSSSAFFTWQGQFDKNNRPGGNLQLNNIEAAVVAPFLGRESKDVEGIADISGLLSVALEKEGDKPFDYTLKSTRVTVKNLKLKEKGVEWLFVPVLRCEPVSRIGSVTDLGNVFLKNSTVALNSAHLPLIFERFSKQPLEHVIHGLDFSGTIKITDKKHQITALTFNNTILQANRLEQKQINDENFVFSATINKDSSLKAKGSLHIAPLQLAIDIAFSKLRPDQLFSWFSSSPVLTKSQAILSGQGTYRYPQKEYKGTLNAENIVIGEPKKPVLRATNARLDNMSWSGTAQQLTVNYLLLEQPEFSWLRTEHDKNPAAPVTVFLRHMFLPEPGSSQTTKKGQDTFSLLINQVDFNNGTLSYQDSRVSPPLALGVTTINGNLNNIQYPVTKKDSSFELTGNLEKYPFTIEGSSRIVQDPPVTQMSFSAQSLPLSLFSKQIDHKFKGLDLSKSSVSVKSTAQFNNGKLQQSANLVISDLLPKNPDSPSATALAMLSGPDGGLSINLQTDEYEESVILTESLASITTSIVKASINPMLITGNGFKDLIDNQYITFNPGSSQITGESADRLNRFSEFLNSHPRIKLRITGYVDKVEDYTALYKDLVELERKQTEQKNRLLKEKWDEEKAVEKTRIEQQMAEQSGEIKETDILDNNIGDFVPLTPNRVEVTDEMLTVLAMEREKNAILYLAEQLSIPSNQIEPENRAVNRIKNDENYSRANIGLSALFPANSQ